MRKLLKIAAYVLLVLIALPIGLYLLLVLTNLGDENLDPSVQALLDERSAEVPPERNGWLAWIGVRGNPQQDPHAWGRRWLTEVMEKPSAGPDAKYPIADEAAKPLVDSKNVPCDKIDACFDAVAADPAKAGRAVELAAPLFERIERAMAYPAYQELWRLSDPSMPIPPLPFQWRSLSATRFALAVHQGRHDAALAQLGREIDFNRRQLAGAVSLIEKLSAIANLRVRLQLLGHYQRRYPGAAAVRADQLAAMLAPIARDSLDLAPVMATEERQIVHAFRVLLKDPAASLAIAGGVDPAFPAGLAGPLIRRNQTLNELDRQFAVWRTIDRQTGDAYRQALAQAGAALRANEEAAESFGILHWRNTVGHILVAIGSADFRTYFRRRDDLLAQHALVALQLDLLRRGVRDADAIGGEVAARAAELTHAFHGKPPAWDGAKRSLSYPVPTYDNGQPMKTEAPVTLLF